MTGQASGNPLAASDDDIETDALSALGDENRIRILRTLADADRPMTFTELREAVGIRDTGKFNYHLTKLCEYFVRDTPDGYELGHAGSRVIRTCRSGNPETAAQPVEECPVCGDSDCDKLFHIHLAGSASTGF